MENCFTFNGEETVLRLLRTNLKGVCSWPVLYTRGAWPGMRIPHVNSIGLFWIRHRCLGLFWVSVFRDNDESDRQRGLVACYWEYEIIIISKQLSYWQVTAKCSWLSSHSPILVSNKVYNKLHKLLKLHKSQKNVKQHSRWKTTKDFWICTSE